MSNDFFARRVELNPATPEKAVVYVNGRAWEFEWVKRKGKGKRVEATSRGPFIPRPLFLYAHNIALQAMLDAKRDGKNIVPLKRKLENF